MNPINWISWLDWKRIIGCRYIRVHETRLSLISAGISDWWGHYGIGFEFVESSRRFGGLITFLDKYLFQVISVIKSIFFLSLVGYWIGIAGETILVNIYAPRPSREKRTLWSNLLNLMNSRHGNWAFLWRF